LPYSNWSFDNIIVLKSNIKYKSREYLGYNNYERRNLYISFDYEKIEHEVKKLLFGVSSESMEKIDKQCILMGAKDDNIYIGLDFTGSQLSPDVLTKAFNGFEFKANYYQK
jgi:hypothetical protein